MHYDWLHGLGEITTIKLPCLPEKSCGSVENRALGCVTVCNVNVNAFESNSPGAVTSQDCVPEGSYPCPLQSCVYWIRPPLLCNDPANNTDSGGRHAMLKEPDDGGCRKCVWTQWSSIFVRTEMLRLLLTLLTGSTGTREAPQRFCTENWMENFCCELQTEYLRERLLLLSLSLCR